MSRIYLLPRSLSRIKDHPFARKYHMPMGPMDRAFGACRPICPALIAGIMNPMAMWTAIFLAGASALCGTARAGVSLRWAPIVRSALAARGVESRGLDFPQSDIDRLEELGIRDVDELHLALETGDPALASFSLEGLRSLERGMAAAGDIVAELGQGAAPPADLAPARAAVRSLHDTPDSWEFVHWKLETVETPDWTFRDRLFRPRRLRAGAVEAQPIAEGAAGSTFVHPFEEHQIVKMARSGYKDAIGQSLAPDDETVLDYEDFDLARLAALGAAPRPLARIHVSGQPGSVRERIYGRTIGSLRHNGRYGPRERALAYELLTRIAEGGFVARDLNLGNLMIGRRAQDAHDQAWVVDTLGVFVDHETDAAGRLAQMLSEKVAWIAWNGFGLGRPLSRMLETK